MAQVTGFTAKRMKVIEDETVVDGDVIGDELILTRRNGSQINAGNVRGPQGPIGTTGGISDAPSDSTAYVRRNGLWVPGNLAPIRDTLANLNTNNPVAEPGQLIVTISSTPRIMAVGNGVTAWNALPKFYERVPPVVRESDNGQPSTSAMINRTGLLNGTMQTMSVTFTVGDVPWLVVAHEPLWYSTTSGAMPIMHLRDAGGVITASSYGAGGNILASGNYYSSCPDVWELISSPGTHTRTYAFQNHGAGTINVGLDGQTIYTATLLARPLN